MTTSPSRRRTGTRASIGDVARQAGVSLGTVSNVLNRPERVSPATRAKVLAAIEALAYVPSGAARQLRAGRLTTVGAVVRDLAHPACTAVARGIEDRLTVDDHTLMVASSDEDHAREVHHLRLFEEHGVLGVLVTPTAHEVRHLLDLQARGAEVVLLDPHGRVPELTSVCVDDVVGAAWAVGHLIELGHRRIGTVTGPGRGRRRADLRAGARRAVVDAGLDPGEVLVEVDVARTDVEHGVRGAAEALAGAPPPTALFCGDDRLALGALQAVRGVRAGGGRGDRDATGVAVVGYGDLDVAAELATPLTSVRRPMHRLGHAAADLLLRSAAGEPVEALTLLPELVVRASSGPPR